MAQKPSTPKGTRDFSPDEMMRRNFIFDTIRSVFKKYGYQPIETPAMENIETLTGKYGEEGDQLLFKILNSRPFEAKDEKKQQMRYAFERTLQQNTNSDVLTEKALRYDLTVPFARYVVQHQNEITFPFKRYQIQPVWRADRPQKGRYREFFQCDADVIGSDSLINEVELVQMIDEAFTAFGVPVTIKINNRKILSGIAEVIGEKEKIVDITVAIDKLDKIGVEGVNKELAEKGISEIAIDRLQPLISFSGDYNAKIELLNELISTSETGRKGIEEVKYVFGLIGNGELKTATCELDITLARGLNYYTGAIFEVKANKGTLTSSICGGGRYDDLTGIFGLPNMSGVGISFGIDRIFDVLNEVGYPEDVTAKEGTRVLFANFGGEDERHSISLLKKVRDAGIAAEIYLDAVKMGKQFKYADAKKIPYVAIIGENERTNNTITLKNMASGEQSSVTLSELISALNK
ncbi:MAG: histidine--tRNA ligase [Bacteroidia bacterium]|nr:histidine--tRNA ligase [Bacteroidia bacterium]